MLVLDGGLLVLNSEKFAYWHLRLNGFLTIVNFVVHPETGTNQKTELDILAVRFPYRKELGIGNNPMMDDDKFTGIDDRPYIVMAEVKKGMCNVNSSWTERSTENIQRVLHAIGAFQCSEIDEIAHQIHGNGKYISDDYYFTIAAFGCCENNTLRNNFPCVPQITWHQVLSFIYGRFDNYKREKAHHPQWDEAGRKLWKLFEQYSDVDQFTEEVMQEIKWR